MDKRPVLAQSAPRSVTLSPRTDWGVNAAACASTSSLASRVLQTHVIMKYFSIHQANNSSVRVRRSIRCASEATTENTPHRPPVGFAKKVTNNEYRPIKYLEKFSKEGQNKDENALTILLLRTIPSLGRHSKTNQIIVFQRGLRIAIKIKDRMN